MAHKSKIKKEAGEMSILTNLHVSISLTQEYIIEERESPIVLCNSCCMSSRPFAIPPNRIFHTLVKGHELIQQLIQWISTPLQQTVRAIGNS